MWVGLGYAAVRWADAVLRRSRASGPHPAQITERRVARRLAAEPAIDATTLRAHALTPDVVELTGLVADGDAAREAVARARAAGVAVVVDRIEIATR